MGDVLVVAACRSAEELVVEPDSLDDSNYVGLDFGRSELTQVMEENYEAIIEFITQPGFQKLFAEMMDVLPSDRPKFVTDIWLNKKALEDEGLVTPPGILIQTSAFGDRRPTLFVVKKYLPEKYHRAWENVNWTFNNDFEDSSVPRDADSSWRLPLSVSVQNHLISRNIDLQCVPKDQIGLVQELHGPDIVKSERVA